MILRRAEALLCAIEDRLRGEPLARGPTRKNLINFIEHFLSGEQAKEEAVATAGGLPSVANLTPAELRIYMMAFASSDNPSVRADSAAAAVLAWRGDKAPISFILSHSMLENARNMAEARLPNNAELEEEGRKMVRRRRKARKPK